MSEPVLTTDPNADDRRAGEDRRARAGGLVAAFWVADALVLGLIIFFAIVGGAAHSTVLAIVAIAAAAALAVHSLLRQRRQRELTLADRRIRERRGF